MSNVMGHMRRALSTLILGLSAASSFAAPLRAADVIAFAASQGESAAIKKYFECGPAGEEAYGLVASGSAEWLEVAVQLLGSSDACVTESLHDSIARALVRTPHRVLALVDSSPLFGAESICVPFLSSEEEPLHHLEHLRRAEVALASVNDPSLQPAKRQCMVEFQKTRKALQLVPNNSVKGTSRERAAPYVERYAP